MTRSLIARLFTLAFAATLAFSSRSSAQVVGNPQLVDLNPFARAIATGIGVPLTDQNTAVDGYPSVYVFGYPYLAGGTGGNADYAVDATCLVPLDPAAAVQVARRMLKSGFIRPNFYLGAPLRMAGAYTTAMRPLGYPNGMALAPEDRPDGTCMIEGFPVCGYDPEHLPAQIFRVLAKRDDLKFSITLPMGLSAQTTVGSCARTLLAFESAGVAGMARAYWIPNPGAAPGNSRFVGKFFHVILNATDFGVAAPEDQQALVDFTLGNVLPFYEHAPGAVVQTYAAIDHPGGGTPYFPPIADDAPWSQVNEWCILSNGLRRLAKAWRTIPGGTAVADRLDAWERRNLTWITEAVLADGSTPYFVTFKAGFGIKTGSAPVASIASSIVGRHYNVYGGNPAIHEWDHWAYWSLCRAAELGIPTAKEKADVILAAWRATPVQWSWLNGVVQGGDVEQVWMIGADGKYVPKVVGGPIPH